VPRAALGTDRSGLTLGQPGNLELTISCGGADDSQRHTKFVHEGEYVAEVEVELLESAEGWAPYLSLEEAQKLDEVREASYPPQRYFSKGRS